MHASLVQKCVQGYKRIVIDRPFYFWLRLGSHFSSNSVTKTTPCSCTSNRGLGLFLKKTKPGWAPPILITKVYCTEGGDMAEKNPKMTRHKAASAEREKYLNMPLEEKRKNYRCGKHFNKLSDILTWRQFFEQNRDHLQKYVSKKKRSDNDMEGYKVRDDLNEKVSIWKGDITSLEIDCIVNAANGSLLGGGGVDGAIHSAAGSSLKAECATLGGCDTGDSKLTGGFKLPAKYVIHTVGPIGENARALRSCYKTSLKAMLQEKQKSVAFPCISTGIYGYPNEKAVKEALGEVRTFLEEHGDKVERIIFCLFLKVDVQLYEEYMQTFFPIGDGNEADKKVSEKEPAQSVEGKKVEGADAKTATEILHKDDETQKDNKVDLKSEEREDRKDDTLSESTGDNHSGQTTLTDSPIVKDPTKCTESAMECSSKNESRPVVGSDSAPGMTTKNEEDKAQSTTL